MWKQDCYIADVICEKYSKSGWVKEGETENALGSQMIFRVRVPKADINRGIGGRRVYKKRNEGALLPLKKHSHGGVKKLSLLISAYLLCISDL